MCNNLKSIRFAIWPAVFLGAIVASNLSVAEVASPGSNVTRSSEKAVLQDQEKQGLVTEIRDSAKQLNASARKLILHLKKQGAMQGANDQNDPSYAARKNPKDFQKDLIDLEAKLDKAFLKLEAKGSAVPPNAKDVSDGVKSVSEVIEELGQIKGF